MFYSSLISLVPTLTLYFLYTDAIHKQPVLLPLILITGNLIASLPDATAHLPGNEWKEGGIYQRGPLSVTQCETP